MTATASGSGAIGLRCGAALAAGDYAQVRREMIFGCGKWDPRVGDTESLAAFPLVLAAATWRALGAWALALAAETEAAERRLLAAPPVWRELGLPRELRRALTAERGADAPSAAAFRTMRFDFHPGRDGWWVSEVNSDVPGGLIEAGEIAGLVAAHYPQWRVAGDPAAAIAAGFRRQCGGGATVGLVHATAYTDDRQAMVHLARRLEEAGLGAVLLSPENLEWRGGWAHSVASWWSGAPAALFRFFPGEWLPGLPRRCGWERFFRGAQTPLANPAWALLSQSKRFVPAARAAGAELPAWERLQPRTCDPRAVPAGEREAMVLKPTWGRVGEDIALAGVTAPRQWRARWRAAWWRPCKWAAQERASTVAVESPFGPVYPVVGVYVVDGAIAGAYGRVARRPLIDAQAQDAAVLIEEERPPASFA